MFRMKSDSKGSMRAVLSMVNMEGMCRPELESSECRTFWAFASHHQAGIELLEKLVPALVGLFKVGTQDHGRGKPLEVFKMGK